MEFVVKTDVGVVRKENQDRAAVIKNEEATMAILCDGMGGHNGGSFAASTTIDVFGTEFQRGFKKKHIDRWFKETIEKSKKAMKKIAGDDYALLDMGTTLTLAIIYPKTIYVYNIGDSRIYLFNGLLHQITRDHNLRNHYIDKYNYSPEDAAKVVGAMALTSALGPTKKTTIDPFIVKRNDSIKYLILTCDGIHDYITKPTFSAIIENMDSTIEDKSINLITASIKGKSSDNLTNIIVDLGDE